MRLNWALQVIELKIGSDNPVYAVFELLGYALTYVHARRTNLRGRGKHDVLSATGLELLVLAPCGWYDYRHRAGSEDEPFAFDWLTGSLTEGMTSFAGFDIQLRFESFIWAGDKVAAATDIHGRLS